jgi:hypothetical protein
MNEKELSISLPQTATTRVLAYCLGFVEDVIHAFDVFRVEVARSFQDMARMVRVMILLHSTEDYESILRLYGIKNPSKG